MKPENQGQQVSAAMAHYKDQINKMRRKDAPATKPNVAIGKDEMLRRRKEQKVASDKKAKKGTFFRKLMKKKPAATDPDAPPAAAGPDAPPAVAGPVAPAPARSTPGARALEALIATCSESNAAQVPAAARAAISALEADLAAVKAAVADAGIGSGNGAVSPANAAKLRNTLANLGVAAVHAPVPTNLPQSQAIL